MLFEVAPAKINLFLHVLGRLPNGYHALESLAVFAGLQDVIALQPNSTYELKLKTPTGWMLSADDNLVTKAAISLSEVMDKPLDFSLLLEKNIPIAAGLGGGSADAGACLRLLCRHWKLDWRNAEVAALAEALGADVPICLHSKPALMKGMGEDLSFIEFPPLHILLVNPNKSVSTASIFNSLNLASGQTLHESTHSRLNPNLTSKAVFSLMQQTRNDLQPTACELEPSIANCLKVLSENVSDKSCVRMTGSGATCFALVKTWEQASAIARKVSDQLPDAWVWTGPLINT